MPVIDFPSNHTSDEDLVTRPPVMFGLLRGESDGKLSEIATQDLIYRDFVYVLAIMCAPEDGGLRLRLNHALAAHELYEALKVVSDVGLRSDVDGDVALSFGDREDPKLLIEHLLGNDKVAHVSSGYILRWIISRWQSSQTRNEASLTKAASVIEDWAKTQRIPGFKRQNITRNIWPQFASVAHLWAALHMAQDMRVNITTPLGFCQFCGAAQWLLEQGASIVPKGRRQGEAVLNLEQAWAVPDSHVQRMDDGAIGTRFWISDPAAHDIRNIRAGFPEPKPV